MQTHFDRDAFNRLYPEIGPDQSDQDAFDVIRFGGEVVADFRWSTDNPGVGAGAETIVQFRGQYFGFSSEPAVLGPFKNWEDALIALDLGTPDSEVIELSPTTWEISCSLISTEALIDRLNVPEGGSVVVNGTQVS